MKEVVKGRVPDTMDTLVKQTESPFTPEVLHYPLPAKFRMSHVEAFDGVKDPVDHLNTYKNQMELHGYPDPVRCRAFATTLKGPAMAWFNRIPPSTKEKDRMKIRQKRGEEEKGWKEFKKERKRSVIGRKEKRKKMGTEEREKNKKKQMRKLWRQNKERKEKK